MASLQFNFSNPGARSLAMAGALTGAGDDATGAWTNPGGLTNITRPEVGVEFRGFDFETPFVVRRPLQRHADEPRHRHRERPDRRHLRRTARTASSFVSAVVPKSRFAFAFYRTEVANFETNISTQGAFFDSRPADGARRRAPLPARQRRPRPEDRQLRRLGRGPADRPDLGRRRRLVLRLRARLDQHALRLCGDSAPRGLYGGFFGAPLLIDGATCSRREFINGEDTAVGVNVGASISPNDKLRIGASYRQGPKFDICTIAAQRLRRQTHCSNLDQRERSSTCRT